MNICTLSPQDYTQIKLNRLRDEYVAVNRQTDPAITAELLVGDMLESKGYAPEEIYAVQGVVAVLVNAGVLTVHAEKLEAAYLSELTTATSTTGTPKRRLQSNVGCCPCSPDRHANPPNLVHTKDEEIKHVAFNMTDDGASPPAHPRNAAPTPDRTDPRACERTLLGCEKKSVQLAADRRSMYKSMKAMGQALRRTAAARSYYLFVKDEVHSFEDFEALSKSEQEATRQELATQLLLTCKEYGLQGVELQEYAHALGMEVPDLTKTSDAELENLGREMAAQNLLENVAKSMGKDMGKEGFVRFRDTFGDAALRRIGVEPSPELYTAFGDFATEASRFITLSRQAMEAQGILEPGATEAYQNATAIANRLASTFEGVNVTDVLVTATGLMMDAEPYLTNSIDNPVDDATRQKMKEPWQIILKLSQIEKAAQQQRKSFTMSLKEDNVLDGILLLHEASGTSVESPLMQQLDFGRIAEITEGKSPVQMRKK
jgi:hypothetical protein